MGETQSMTSIHEARGIWKSDSGTILYVRRRDNGPTLVSSLGIVQWKCPNSSTHRVEGPAYYLHREEGPACYSPSTRKAYYYTRGEKLSPEEFKERRIETFV